MPTENGDNCQYASGSSRNSTLLIGEGLKYIIDFTDVILNMPCPESVDELQEYGVISQR